ncbi:MAG: hypothetical protein QOI35_2503 [Cryptosporangiaceae bacterium]|jgi:hypothetical protein|nr:hypothetical protein [Cryptosporangiaceae bacterium]MDQ1656427.1 hypothetical protein [Cryptosporangiaceae bacterium]
MARRERPVDPAAGPLEAFAFELRKLRGEAGNPTYRALAKSAGFSATTLSEAAAGRRRPSLDVTLAYAMACGGGEADWRERWLALGAIPEPAATPSAVAEAEPAGSGAGVGEEPVADPARMPAMPSGRRVPRWAMVAGVTLVAAGVLAGTTAALWPASDRTPAASPPQRPGCPALTGKPLFTAETYHNGARIRRGPSRDEPEVRRIPAGCTIGLTGYCIGQVVVDDTAGTPDVRWFLTSGGTVASAVVHGNPPVGTKPSRCAHDMPIPESISLRLTRAKDGSVALSGAGQNVQIAGFAVGLPVGPGKSDVRWQQLRMTTDPDLTATWRPRPGTGRALLAATACLGGDGPTSAADVLSVPPGHPEKATPAGLTGEDLATARRAACQYPGPN